MLFRYIHLLVIFLKPRHWLTFLGIAVAAAVLHLLDNNIHSVLNFDAQMVRDGQWWRLLTGHLLHTNFNHLMLNLSGLLLLWALHGEYYDIRYTWLFLLGGGLLISTALFFFSDTTHYVGLSAIIHTFFTWGAIQDIKLGMKTGWLLLLGVLLKVIWEQLYGGSVEVMNIINSNVAIDSHLYGAVAGLVLVFLFRPDLESLKAEMEKEKQKASGDASEETP